MGILVLRMVGQLTHPSFIEEETVGWWFPTFDYSPLETLTQPYNGFRYPIVRLVFLASRLVPDTLAPLLTTAVLIAVVALVAAFIASDRMTPAIPDRRVRLAAGLALALLPFGNARIYSTIVNVHWFLTIYLAALALATPATARWRMADRIGAAIAASSVPAVLFLAPIYVWRRRYIDHWIVAVVVLAAVLQLASLATSPRLPMTALEPWTAVVTAYRSGIAPIGDRLDGFVPPWPFLRIALAGLMLSAAFHARDRLPGQTMFVFSIVAVAIALVGMAGSDPSRLAAQDEAVRYFVIGTWLLATLTIAGMMDRRRTTLVLAIAFAIGLASTFWLTPDSGPPWTVGHVAALPTCIEPSTAE